MEGIGKIILVGARGVKYITRKLIDSTNLGSYELIANKLTTRVTVEHPTIYMEILMC